MAEQYRIRDAGIDRKYYSQIPNMIDDAGLSPSAFRLYVHLKRVAGAGSEGACWESTTTLAQNCGCSAPTIVSAKKELQETGLIEIEEKASSHGEFPSHWITIVNVWEANELMYNRENILQPDDLFRIIEPTHAKNLYRTIQKIYIGLYKKLSLKNNSIRRTTEEEPILILKFAEEIPTSKPERKKKDRPSKIKPAEKDPSLQSMMFGRLAELCCLDMRLNASRLGKTARDLINAGYGLEDLATFQAWWKGNDWRGKKGQPPGLQDILNNIRKALEGNQPAVISQWDGDPLEITPDDYYSRSGRNS